MKTKQLYRTVSRIWNRILDLVSPQLSDRRGAPAPIVLVIDRVEDELAYRRRSR
jgi:hypothetical protein